MQVQILLLPQTFLTPHPRYPTFPPHMTPEETAFALPDGDDMCRECEGSGLKCCLRCGKPEHGLCPSGAYDHKKGAP